MLKNLVIADRVLKNLVIADRVLMIYWVAPTPTPTPPLSIKPL